HAAPRGARDRRLWVCDLSSLHARARADGRAGAARRAGDDRRGRNLDRPRPRRRHALRPRPLVWLDPALPVLEPLTNLTSSLLLSLTFALALALGLFGAPPARACAPAPPPGVIVEIADEEALIVWDPRHLEPGGGAHRLVVDAAVLRGGA